MGRGRCFGCDLRGNIEALGPSTSPLGSQPPPSRSRLPLRHDALPQYPLKAAEPMSQSMPD